jgi:tetratricopeptide (TPR) repeat protein
VLVKLKLLDEALAAWNELITRFGKSGRPFIRKQVYGAMANRGAALGLMNQPEEALKALDEFFFRLGDLETQVEPGILAIAAGATANQVLALLRLGRYDEALKKLTAALSTKPFQETSEMLVPMVAGILTAFIMPPGLLGRLKELMGSRPDLLAAGLSLWLQSQLPLRPEAVNLFVEKGKRLQHGFGDIPEAKMTLDVIAAVRGHAEGDAKALLALPKEIRHLVETPAKP